MVVQVSEGIKTAARQTSEIGNDKHLCSQNFTIEIQSAFKSSFFAVDFEELRELCVPQFLYLKVIVVDLPGLLQYQKAFYYLF